MLHHRVAIHFIYPHSLLKVHHFLKCLCAFPLLLLNSKLRIPSAPLSFYGSLPACYLLFPIILTFIFHFAFLPFNASSFLHLSSFFLRSIHHLILNTSPPISSSAHFPNALLISASIASYPASIFQIYFLILIAAMLLPQPSSSSS